MWLKRLWSWILWILGFKPKADPPAPLQELRVWLR